MKHTILFLAANPTGTNQLALDCEARAIHVELERSGQRDQFEFLTRWAAEPLDLLRELRRLKPMVVHFSGHGEGPRDLHTSENEQRRDVGGGASGSDVMQHGLYFRAADGTAHLVSAPAIEQTFGAAGSSVRLVVLSACYSDAQAQALLAHVDCVVGMHGAIHDATARLFAVGFYGGLGEGEPIGTAFRQGRAAISLERSLDSDLPQLKVRPGVNADRLVLTEEPVALSPKHSPLRAGSGSHSGLRGIEGSHPSLIIDDVIVGKKRKCIRLDIRIRSASERIINITRADVHILQRLPCMSVFKSSADYDMIIDAEHNMTPVSHVLRSNEVDRFVLSLGFSKYNTSCLFSAEIILLYNGNCNAISKAVEFDSAF